MILISRDPIAEEGEINLYGYVGNNPISQTDAFGLYITYGQTPSNWSSASSNAYWNNYRKNYDKFWNTPTGKKELCEMESSSKEYHINPSSSQQSITLGNNVQLGWGETVLTLAHEFQHAITNVTGNPDTISNVSDPQDKIDYPMSSSEIAEREAMRMQNIVQRELMPPAAQGGYQGAQHYTYPDGSTISVPHPFGR